MKRKTDLRSISWQDNCVVIIDQTRLPGELRFLRIKDVHALWQAVKELKVRGAPALGAAAGLGAYLAVRNSKAKDFESFFPGLKKALRYIATSRPTARNLFYGLERIERIALHNRSKGVAQIKRLILKEAQRIMDEDRVSCRLIGEHGERLLKSGDTVLTVCNAGMLATVGEGTALGVLYAAQRKGKRIKVYACETRPLLQGARLTTWELMKHGLDVTLICDNMAATLMRQGKIDKVIAGADRIAANGDAANKIGTYSLAVLARFHRIPFYIAAPASTFDVSIAHGKDIPIEERAAEEVTALFFRKPVAPERVKVYNPAFDVTDQALIKALITDKGVIRPPYHRNIRRIISLKRGHATE